MPPQRKPFCRFAFIRVHPRLIASFLPLRVSAPPRFFIPGSPFFDRFRTVFYPFIDRFSPFFTVFTVFENRGRRILPRSH
jgi:hypothetical protein